MKFLVGAKILVALVVSMAAGAQAAPIVFTSAQYDTTAVATSGAAADVNSNATPASALPLLSTANVLPANDYAAAFAFASPGLLSASAEADSFTGAAGANADAQSHFVGTFLGSGRLILNLGFDSTTSLVGGATAAGTLFVLVTNAVGATTTTLFNDFFTVGNNITLELVSTGGINTLDLLLFSEAATLGDVQLGQNFSQVVFAGTIPLPATLPLVFVGLAAMAGVRRKAASASAPARA